jgi:hypothetical protein
MSEISLDARSLRVYFSGYSGCLTWLALGDAFKAGGFTGSQRHLFYLTAADFIPPSNSTTFEVQDRPYATILKSDA